MRTWACGGILSLAVVAVYWPTTTAGYVWDDDDYLTSNPTVTEPGGLVRVWLEPAANLQYYPLYFTTFWIEYRIWGANALGYHVDNVLLHLLNALLLWRLLARLGIPGSWWVAALFALHPVNVESVAWVTERRNVLSAFFCLIAALAFVRFRHLDTPAEASARPQWSLYAIAAAAFAAALLSKSAVLTLPAALLVIVWWKSGRIGWRDVQLAAPLFAMSVGMAFITRSLEAQGLAARAIGEDMQFTLVERALIAGRAVWFYVATIIWPANLIHVYPRWTVSPDALQLAAPLGACLALLALALLSRRIGRAPLAALLLFGGSLTPVLGLVNFGFMQYSFVADRFVYLACIALMALLVGGLVRALQHTRAAVRVGATVGGIALLAVLGVRAHQQCRIYQDAGTLWRDTLAKHPESWVARLGLGTWMTVNGQPNEAVPLLEEVVALRPDLAAPYSNLGDALVRADRATDALRVLRNGRSRFPDDLDLLSNLAGACKHAGLEAEAIESYRQVIKRDPRRATDGRRLAELLVDRATRLQASGLRSDAIALLSESYDIATRLHLTDLAIDVESRIGLLRSSARQ